MSNLKSKREAVLEKLYDELLEKDVPDALAEYTMCGPDGKKAQNYLVQLIQTLENANAADDDIHLKADIVELDNANKSIEVMHNDRNELTKILVTAIVTMVTNVAWGIIFTKELEATRLFEVEGTETSAASRWLKQSFPKMRLF